jgi:hypothetical protein
MAYATPNLCFYGLEGVEEVLKNEVLKPREPLGAIFQGLLSVDKQGRPRLYLA